MKKLNLENASYRYLEQSFREWLDVQGYAATTVYNLPNQIRELFYYLEKEGIKNIKGLEPKHIKAYYEQLKERGNQRRGGGLSAAHLNKHIQAIRKFADYLRKVGRMQLPAFKMDNEQAEHKITYLTEEEIKQLFAATSQNNNDYNYNEKQDAYQSRDRAMLTIFYGCGLRRNEGVNLDIGDINWDSSLLHVRHGKNYKERFVPISKASLKHLQDYVYDYRPQLLRYKTDALFINYQGTRMQGQGLLIRLKQLQYKTEDLDIQEKEIGLHTLRHSIATHLLAAGMPLESISQFLGHSSLESTQIYTHLLGIETPQPYDNIPVYETIQLSEED
jgi:integrase/recombinase XerD